VLGDYRPEKSVGDDKVQEDLLRRLEPTPHLRGLVF
jgi:hypothetical protein